MSSVTSLRRLFCAAAVGLLLAASAHCSGSTVVTKTDGGGPPPPNLPVPVNHRPTAPTCPGDRPPGVNQDAGVPDSGTFPGECTRDSDCTQGTNGRCLPPQHNRAGDSCSYDACASDTDCASGQLCECGASTGGPYGRSGNQCLTSNCRVDSDCGAGGSCSQTWDTGCGAYNGIVGYYCHTPNDDCTNDDQCREAGNGYCAWQPTVNKWACSYGFCAG